MWKVQAVRLNDPDMIKVRKNPSRRKSGPSFIINIIIIIINNQQLYVTLKSNLLMSL